MTNAKNTEILFRRAARKVARVRANMPVEIVEGSAAPTLQGEHGGHCTDGSGYEYSTERVVVGRDWSAATPCDDGQEKSK